jgi:hypothetical protein
MARDSGPCESCKQVQVVCELPVLTVREEGRPEARKRGEGIAMVREMKVSN